MFAISFMDLKRLMATNVRRERRARKLTQEDLADESAEGTGALRTSDIHDWRERGRSPRDCGARLGRRRDDQQVQAVSLFITDMLAASTAQGNGVTRVATPFHSSGK